MGRTLVRLRLLGSFDLRRGEQPVPVWSGRARLLLAYLVLHRDGPVARKRLAALLWPDSTEQQARTNLRHVLHDLRRLLPENDGCLEVTPRALRWQPESPCWVDVVAFEDAVRHGDDGLAGAAELYRGDLLDGHDDEWLVSDRERLRRGYLDVLQQLSENARSQGDLDSGIGYAERLLTADPLREETYRTLIGLYQARGDRARALRTYHACVATLDRDLGVAPSTATTAAYESLLRAREKPAEPARAAKAPHRGLPALVGRERERSQLTAWWRATEAGEQRLVLVTGEPGIGKSRLVEEFRSWAAHRGAMTATARAYPAEGPVAYGPVVTWLREPDLAARLPDLHRGRVAELARLLPELADQGPHVTAPVVSGQVAFGPDDQRQRLFDAVEAAVVGTGRPVLLVADDLQWWDTESLRVLHYLLRAGRGEGQGADQGVRLLVAATCRWEDVDSRHPVRDLVTGLRALDALSDVRLHRFTRDETAVLAGRLIGTRPGAAELDTLFRETEGNPLFVLETVRAGRRSPRVQAVIESRLQDLSNPALDIVRSAATVGRAFTVDVVADASGLDSDRLVDCLDELWRRGLVREQGADAYDFSHDKIREVAYAGMSPAQRRHQHRQVARALERVHAERLDEVSAALAAHHEKAGAIDEAVTCYLRATEATQRLAASEEGVRLLDRALTLLATRPPGRARDLREAEIRTASLPVLAAAEGFASPSLADVHERALALTRSLGVEPSPPLLRSLAVARLAAGDFDAARRYGERLREYGDQDDDDVLRVEADYVLGIAAFWQADFVAARAHFEAAVARYRPEHRGTHIVRYMLDPQVICLSRLANTWWFLGRPDEAVRARDEALARAREIGHPPTTGTAITFAAFLALDMGDLDRVRADAAALRAEGHLQWRPTRVTSEALDALVQALDGDAPAGIARLQALLDDSKGAEHAPGFSHTITRLLLAACEVAGDAQIGLAAAEHALATAGGARVWEPEFRRLADRFAGMTDVAGADRTAGTLAGTPAERSRNATS